MLEDPQSRKEYSKLDYENLQAEASDRLKYQVEFGHASLRNLMLTNGGAIIALFTFIGNSSSVFGPTNIWWAFSWFSLGLFLTLVGYLSAFISQYLFFECSMFQMWNAQHNMMALPEEYPQEKIQRSFSSGNIALFVSVLSAILSLVFFVIGSICALNGVL